MEQEKDTILQQIAKNNRSALVYIEMFPDSILTLHWRIYKLFNRSRSATYTNLHRLFSRIHKSSPKDERKAGVAGTGFFIAPDTLVTNIHVVAWAKTVAAKQHKVKRTPLYHPDHKDLLYAYKTEVSKEPDLYTIEGVKAFDVKNDLVLLKVAGKCANPLHLGNSENVKVGDRVYTLAYENAEYKCVAGTISGADKRGRFEIKTQFLPGYSGSPVLNSTGEVIGIACAAGLTMADHGTIITFELGSAIPANVLNSLLEENEEIVHFAAWQKLSGVRAHAARAKADGKQAQGKNKSAIAIYNRVLKLNPDVFEVYGNRGAAKSSIGDYVGAIEDYDKAIQLNPNDTIAYYNRGRAKGLLGESKADQGVLVEARHHYQMAIDDYTEAINQDPNLSIVYNNRGWTQSLLGQVATKEGNSKEAHRLYQEAVSDSDMALQLQTTGDIFRSSFYHTRGAAKVGLGDHNGAIEDFNESILLNPKKASFYHDRGLSKEALEQHEEAETDFTKAKELDPDLKNKRHVPML